MGLAYGLGLECEGKWNRGSPSCETWCRSHPWLNFFMRKKEKERKRRERKGKKREGKRKVRKKEQGRGDGRKERWMKGQKERQ